MNSPRKSAASAKMIEAKGTLVPVDRSLFFATIRHLAKMGLLDDFENYLEKNSVFDLVMDVNFANQLKRFLLAKKRADEFSKMIMRCSCGAEPPGGGGGPTGVRG